MNINKLIFFLIIFISAFSLNADEIKSDAKNTEFYLYTGMFDFSDNGKRATLIGFQHQNEELNRDTFMGNLSPVTGALITADNASYLYTGIQAQYHLGKLNINPSFTPGLYF